MSNESTNLALVPLHPGGINKKEPQVKAFPLVLGRTNLANWWWNRDLTLIFRQSVAKNPRLITVFPERPDCLLREFDILSIGRRDREPWMRFQVVRSNGASNRQQSRRKDKRRNNANSRNGGAIPGVDERRTNNSPPEWITTTRKRKSSRLSSTKPILQQHERSVNIASSATQQFTLNPEHQKRRRKRSRDSSYLLGTHEKADKHFQLGHSKAAHHMHLVVQDHEKGATLLKSEQLRRREISERRITETHLGGSNGGRMPFVSKRSEERLDSNIPIANDTKMILETSQQKDSIENPEVQQVESSQPPIREVRISKAARTAHPKPNEGPGDVKYKGTGAEDVIQSVEVRSSPSQDRPSQLSRNNAPSKPQCVGGKHQMLQVSARSLTQFSSSIMNMPAVGSTCERSNTYPSNPLLPESRISSTLNRTMQYSDANLRYWQQIVEGEPGKVPAFRRALASIIVAKNRGNEIGDAIWLPDLLDDNAA